MRHFDHLDGMRGLLALAVAASHIVGALTAYGQGRPLVGAYLAVDYFFILSGFVLSHYLTAREITPAQFFWKRFWRLWPLHCATTLITAFVYFNNRTHGLFYPAHAPLSVETLALNVSFLSASGVVETEMLNNPAWSISVEFWLSAVVLIWIFKAPIAAALSVSIAAYALAFTSGHGLMAEGGAFQFTTFGMLRGVAGMSLGIFLHRIESKFSSLLQRLSPSAYDGLLALCAVTMTVLLVRSEGGLSDLLAIFLIVPFFAVSFLSDRASAVAGVLSSYPLVWLGRISFALYLVHTAVIILILPVTYVGQFGLLGAFMITIIASLAAAHVLHKAVELPFAALLNRPEKKRTASPA